MIHTLWQLMSGWNSTLRKQIAYAKRWALYSRYYFDPIAEPAESARGVIARFCLPPIVDMLSGTLFLTGRHCCYRQSELLSLENPVITSVDFDGCVGAWSFPLILLQGRGFTAEPQLSRANVAMKFGRPSPPAAMNARRIAGEAFHLLGPCQANWYHTLIDHLSLVARWDLLGLKDRGVRLIMPEYWAYRWPEIPELLGIDESQIVWFGREPLQVDRLLLPAGVRVRSASRTCLAAVAQTFANPDDLLELRRRILSRLAGDQRERRRIIIDRSDGWRPPRTKHFNELAKELTGAYGFERVLMGELRPSEQLKVFRDNEMIIAEHGAGLASFLAASNDTVVVEVLPESPAEVQAHGYNFIATCLRHHPYHTIVDAPVRSLLRYVEEMLDRGNPNSITADIRRGLPPGSGRILP